jgi:DNA-binding response OmpR family regulator
MPITNNASAKKTRVLVIEDDEHTNLLISENLKHEGYSVMSVFDGEEGVRAAQKSMPDLIMLDIMLPGLNGWEVCQKLRADSAPTRAIPIMIVSIVSKDAGPLKKEMGPLTLVNKPFDVRELMSSVKNLLGGKEATGA